MLQMAATRAPWAIFGYSPQLVKAFNEQPKTFVATVEERRRRARQSA